MYLLDKNIVRKAAVGFALLRLRRTVPAVERRCMALLLQGQRQTVRLFIARETYNILVRHETRIEARIVLSLVEVLERGRYFKRWARRLREHGFTSEDASLLS